MVRIVLIVNELFPVTFTDETSGLDFSKRGDGMNVERYLENKGLSFKSVSSVRGKQLLLDDCPFSACGPNHFYIHADTGRFYCHKCGIKGGLLLLKEVLGDTLPMQATPQASQHPFDRELYTANVLEAHNQLMEEIRNWEKNDHDVVEFFDDRKFDYSIINTFKIGVHEDPVDGYRYLIIPYWKNGKLTCVKRRSLPPAPKANDRRGFKGMGSGIWNADVLQHTDEIIITEGEMDAFAIWSAGFHNVVTAPTGAGTGGIEHLYIQLDRAEKFYICYDTDPAGRVGANELARRLGYERCFNVVVSEGKDANDFLKVHSPEEFQRLLKEAKPFDVDSVTNFGTVLQKMVLNWEDSRHPGLPVPWTRVSRKLGGGFANGSVYIIAGNPKVGKSNFTLQCCTDLAFNYDIPTLTICQEMPPEQLVGRVLSQVTQENWKGLSQSKVSQILQLNGRAPFYIAKTIRGMDMDLVSDTVRACVRRYGIKLLVFDHLHYLIRDVHNQTERVGQAVQRFKELAIEVNIPILLIVHLRKFEVHRRQGPKSPEFMQDMPIEEDLRDSKMIWADADSIILLHRKRIQVDNRDFYEEETEGSYEPETIVRVASAREAGGGHVKLWYHGDQARFEDRWESQTLPRMGMEHKPMATGDSAVLYSQMHGGNDGKSGTDPERHTSPDRGEEHKDQCTAK